MRTHFIFFLFIFSFSACKEPFKKKVEDYYKVPAVTDVGINMVVEIPAGTNHKIEYNPESRKFENDIKDGKIRVVNFLPYPGNYGFIPSTLMDEASGGDGDALDVLLIGESVPTGTVISVKPIATLLLEDDGETDTKIIAIPADSSKQVINPDGFQEFVVEYDAARMIVENWFLTYTGKGRTQLIGWQDEAFALREVEKWKVTPVSK